MATARPTTEQRLASFQKLHILVEDHGVMITGHLVEPLTPLQEKILMLLQLPKEIYDLSFCKVNVESDAEPAIAT